MYRAFFLVNYLHGPSVLTCLRATTFRAKTKKVRAGPRKPPSQMAARGMGVALKRVAGMSAGRLAGRAAAFSVQQRKMSSVPHVSSKVVHVTFSNNAGDQGGGG